MTNDTLQLRAGNREYIEGARRRHQLSHGGKAFEFHWNENSNKFHHKDANCLSSGDCEAVEDGVRELYQEGDIEPCRNCLSEFRETREEEEQAAEVQDTLSRAQELLQNRSG